MIHRFIAWLTNGFRYVQKRLQEPEVRAAVDTVVTTVETAGTAVVHIVRILWPASRALPVITGLLRLIPFFRGGPGFGLALS